MSLRGKATISHKTLSIAKKKQTFLLRLHKINKRKYYKQFLVNLKHYMMQIRLMQKMKKYKIMPNKKLNF